MQENISKAKELMEKTIAALKRDLIGVNTGRATPDLLNPVRVECYGSVSPLNQVSNISVPESTCLTIQVWDKSIVKAVEKGIMEANLGFVPKIEGTTIRINLPRLTEERRKELCKLVKKYGEDKKVAIRNIRRDSLDAIKREKNQYSEDEIKRHGNDIQDLTDNFVKQIDNLVSEKEKDIMNF